MNTTSCNRQFLPPLAELIDRLTITQIKLVLIKDGKNDFLEEIKKLNYDINLIIKEKSLPLSSDLIQMITIIAQMNLHIWYNKDKMQQNLKNEDIYLQSLKLAHQLNGYRNRMKNKLLALEDIKDEGQVRSNFETDGLNWDISI